MDNIEGVIIQCFDPTLSPKKKSELENILNEFLSDNKSYQKVEFLLKTTANENVRFYCLNIFEDYIATRWHYLQVDEKLEIRNFIYNYLKDNNSTLSRLILNKGIKIIVNIAKRDWPLEWPELIPDLLKLNNSFDELRLSFTIIKTINEEFTSSREDINASRKIELKQLFLRYVPMIISRMMTLLENIYKEVFVMNNISPISANGTFEPNSFMLSPGTPNINTGFNNLPMIGISPTSGINSFSFPSPVSASINNTRIDNQRKEICVLILENLNQFFTWIPFSKEYINSQYLSVILSYAQLYQEDLVELGILAMSCINEIFSKNYVPIQFISILLDVASHTFEILKNLSVLRNIDNTYLEKFTEHLGLFITQHLKRAETYKDFPISDFLILFLNYSTAQPDIFAFERCLGLWYSLLEYFTDHVNDDEKEKMKIESYQPIMTQFFEQLLLKARFTSNEYNLKAFNDKTEDIEYQTELDHFINICADIVLKLSELYPECVLQKLLGLFFNDFQHMQSETTFHSVKNYAKDMKLTLQCFGQIAYLFTAEFENNFPSTLQLIQQFMNALSTCMENEIYLKGHCFTKLCVQLYNTIRLQIHWMVKWHTLSQNDEKSMKEFMEFINGIVNLCIMGFNDKCSDILMSASASLLNSITSTLRPSKLLIQPSIQGYLSVLNNQSVKWPIPVKQQIYSAFVNIFTLPGLNQSPNENEWIERTKALSQFIEQFGNVYYNQITQENFISSMEYMKDDSRLLIIHTLTIFSAILKSVREESSNSKTVVFEVLKKYLPATFNLLQPYINDGEILLSIFDFLLNLFDTLQKQIGLTVISKTVNMFFSILNENQIQTIMFGDIKDADALIKFIQLLTVLAEDTSKTIYPLLPDIISYSINVIFKKCFANETPNLGRIQFSYYELIEKILINQWRYFFPNSLIKSMISKNTNTEQDHRNEFIDFLNIILYSFKGKDINCIKKNINTLNMLNEKCNIFSQDVFKDALMVNYLDVLFEILLNKSLDFLRDDIIQIVYLIISNNFMLFTTNYIPHLLTSKCTNFSENQLGIINNYLNNIKDVQSCTENIYILVNDYYYFSRINCH
ncbi:hypothetical protein PIROE2DRAFT_2577 [Piromyces sp. E2]|nr:hypothetical protein PIROE2DRAFT_2577 [Piromyces sp. E2]|eukprot:OUM69485.1 hypothetical protein PIROE2DRAFT_2577 [Piromyces sp. E2]